MPREQGATYVAVRNLLETLSREELEVLTENPNAVLGLARSLIVKARETALTSLDSYVICYTDEQAVGWLINHKDYSESDAKSLVAKYRKLAKKHNYFGPIAWRVKEGFTLKMYPPTLPWRWGYVANPDNLAVESFFHEESTKNALVFWIPCLLSGSENKKADEQYALLENTRESLGLPRHHLVNFGSAPLVVALMRAEHRRTGDPVPSMNNGLINNSHVRTETRFRDTMFAEMSDGRRCDYWKAGFRIDFTLDSGEGLCYGSKGDNCCEDIGVFALGVELED